MATYTRLGSYLLASELASDPLGRISRGLTLSGGGFDRHHLIRTFSDELTGLGLARLAEARQVADTLAGARGYGANYQIETGTTPCVVCDLIPGRSLAQVLRKTREEEIPLGVDHALSVLQGLAQSIIQLHGKGIQHGLLSPHSLWVSYEGSTHLLDAPFAAILQPLLPKAPNLAADLAPYRTAAATSPLQQDLFALGAVLFELLTLEQLPSGAGLPEALASATLKAAQEEAPIPGEILALLHRLLLLDEPFSNAPTFSAELEKVLYDGEYSPTTFNMAFFMHTLFREEAESDSQAMKNDQGADFTPFQAKATGAANVLDAGSNSNVLKYSIIGGCVLALAFGGLLVSNMANARRNADLQAKIVALDRENADNNARLLDLTKAQDEAKTREAQLTRAATEGKTAEERTKAKKDLEEARKKTEDLAKQREEALRKRQEISDKTQTIAQTIPKPAKEVAPAPPPVAAPVQPVPATPQPVAAPQPKPAVEMVETPVAVAKQPPLLPPRSGSRKFLPPGLQNTEIKVGLKIYVNEQGTPLKVIVANGVEGHAGYNEAAQANAMATTFTPATRNGKPIKAWITIDYAFGLPK
jgi:TonB family protein